MSFLIAGLGNIGIEYEDTRHNIGFRVVEHIANREQITFASDRLAHIAQYKSRGRNIFLIKPTTFMNLSGKAVRYWMHELKIQQQNLLVILDDLALPFGQLRLRAKGSDGGHNGLKDIDAALGNQNYARLRFGIGNNFPPGRQVSYVLGKWTADEMKTMPEHLARTADAVQAFMFEGLSQAMTKFNK